MSSSAVANANVINLKGSTDIVTEFFNYSVNNILYQRGIYPPESFKRVTQYGLSMMVSTDETLTGYLANIMKQLEAWLMEGRVQKLVMVIKGLETGETLERWAFDCDCNDKENSGGAAQTSSKSQKEVSMEIQAIMRQITASVTFLPLLNEQCAFDLLIYADKEASVPVTWEDSDPCFIAQSESVRLRSFDTKLHKVDVMVSYKVDEDGI